MVFPDTAAAVAESPADGAPMTGLPAMLILADPAGLTVAREALVELELGWEVVFAGSLTEACEVPRLRPVDVILIDLGNSRVDGVEATETLVRLFPAVPVVLMTAPYGVNVALEAVGKGAVNHFPRDLLDSEPAAVLESLREAARRRRSRAVAVSCLAGQQFDYELTNDRDLIPAVIEDVRGRLMAAGLCDHVTARRVGVAVEECLLNAVIHGNLEVSSDVRQQDEGRYYRLIDARRAAAPYADRRVRLRVTLSATEATFHVKDDGPGFDVSKLPDPTDPANLFRVGGRGLLLMRSFMSSVTYNARGNGVTLVKRR